MNCPKYLPLLPLARIIASEVLEHFAKTRENLRLGWEKSALRGLTNCLKYVDNRTPIVVVVVYAKATGSWSILLWPC